MCIYCSVRILFLLCSFDRAFGDASVHEHKQQVSRFFCFPVLLIAQFGDLHGNGIILTFYIMRHFNFRQLFVAIVALLFSVAVSAQQFEVDGIYYDIIGNYTVCVTRGYTEEGATKYSGNIVIPKAVEYNGAGYLVTRINDQAFSGCDELKSITIPNSITSINSYYYCPVNFKVLLKI